MEQAMVCAVLKGMHCGAQGSLRLLEDASGLTLHLQAEALPDTTLRCLLLSAGEEGAVLDLGGSHATPQGTLALTRTTPPAELRLWDAFALTEDWPSGRLLLAGWLHEPAGPLWRLAEAAGRYLQVPVA